MVSEADQELPVLINRQCLLFNYDCCYKIKRKHLKLKGLKYCKKVLKKLCMMISLCHGTLASASALALQGVALALALESVALLTSLENK